MGNHFRSAQEKISPTEMIILMQFRNDTLDTPQENLWSQLFSFRPPRPRE